MPRIKLDIPNLPTSVTAERDGEIGFLRLSRPEKRNALNDTLVSGIEAYFNGLPNDIRAVVLTGDGDHFSAGLDLSELTVRGTVESLMKVIAGLEELGIELIGEGNESKGGGRGVRFLQAASS